LAIMEGVVGLAKAFKREVIAEGVETIAHGVALMQLDCESWHKVLALLALCLLVISQHGSLVESR
jgi:hypothetical protein